MEIGDFKGRITPFRVRIHPACDWWMRGATHGRVTTVGREVLTVRLEVGGADIGKSVKIHPENILEIV